MQTITPWLWFEKDAVGAANFYASVFKDSKILNTKVLGGTPSGNTEIVTMELLGTKFGLMAAGPLFKFNESVSFEVPCETQEEVDHYWDALTADGGQESQCGWLKDKYGVSWQIVPRVLAELMNNPDPAKVNKVTQAMLQMKKLDIAALRKAAE